MGLYMMLNKKKKYKKTHHKQTTAGGMGQKWDVCIRTTASAT